MHLDKIDQFGQGLKAAIESNAPGIRARPMHVDQRIVPYVRGGTMDEVREGDAFAMRLRCARKASGLSVKAMAKALFLETTDYREFEHGAKMPVRLVGIFCVVTRCSYQYMMTGERTAVGPPVIVRSGNLTYPENRCGAPCPFGRFWCNAVCVPQDG